MAAADASNLLQCYNKGCGKKYLEEDNSTDACMFHPGEPIFHDAYKIWSCCKQRSTNFTVFLNYPGCTRSRHCNIKPEIQKPTVTPALQPGEVIEVNHVPKKAMERPNDEEPTVELQTIITSSLKTAIEKKQVLSEKESHSSTDDKISEGTLCQNRGCKCSFSLGTDVSEECIHHPGYPIFHEGMKYWSCCNKRTSDFTEFLNQTGCAIGQHCWKQEDKVKIFLIYEHDNRQFNKVITLEGVILPSKSTVQYFGAKAEIKLKKADTNNWRKLEL